jgi:hypothetical protein
MSLHIHFLGKDLISVGDNMNHIIICKSDVDLLIEMLEATKINDR